jgi:RNA polymerase sigma-70 factor (family 1)
LNSDATTTLETSPLYVTKELLRLASGADQKAFTLLFHNYKHKLYGYVFRLTESEMLAEDIVQDVFLKLWADHESLASIDNFGSYLFRMSKNHVLNHFRRMAQETAIVAEMFREISQSSNDTQEMLASREIEQVLKAAVESLPPQQKMVYKLSREEGKTHDEIAALLKISPNTVKNHMVQALTAIRAQLRRHSGLMLIAATFLSLK